MLSGCIVERKDHFGSKQRDAVMKYVFALALLSVLCVPASAAVESSEDKYIQILDTAIKRCQPGKTCWAAMDKENYLYQIENCSRIARAIELLKSQKDPILPLAERDHGECVDHLHTITDRVMRDHAK